MMSPHHQAVVQRRQHLERHLTNVRVALSESIVVNASNPFNCYFQVHSPQSSAYRISQVHVVRWILSKSLESPTTSGQMISPQRCQHRWTRQRTILFSPSRSQECLWAASEAHKSESPHYLMCSAPSRSLSWWRWKTSLIGDDGSESSEIETSQIAKRMAHLRQ